MTTVLFWGTQLALVFQLTLSPSLHLQYGAGSYIADPPGIYPMTQWSVDWGGSTFIGLGGRTIDEGGFKADWTTVILGARSPSGSVTLHGDGGFDLHVQAWLSPTLAFGFFDSRWFGPSGCTPYCEWSGPYLSVIVQ